jgi:hypothetical protein
MLNALEHNTREFAAFAYGPTAQQNMKARRHRKRQLYLVFSSGRFDHGSRLLNQLNLCFD